MTQDTPRQRLGRLLANKRAELEMTQDDAARKLSARLGEQVKRNYIAAVETQWRMWPSIERLTALADVYEMSQPERLLLMREFGAGDLVYKGVDVELDRDLEELLDHRSQVKPLAALSSSNSRPVAAQLLAYDGC
ncbi:MAG: helix-turn-helix domain-containing protein [Chloroflexota bacterium]|nr:helix-turn-helix domain-containing protein [Chloroflexota bacterium]